MKVEIVAIDDNINNDKVYGVAVDIQPLTLHDQKYVDTCSSNISFQMHVVPPLLLQQPPLFWEGFPIKVGTLLQGLASIQPQEHS